MGTTSAWSAPAASGPLDAVLDLPGSKSLTARALVAAAVADGPTTLRGALHSRDTALMRAALTTLGARFEDLPAHLGGAHPAGTGTAEPVEAVRSDACIPTALRVTPAPHPFPARANTGSGTEPRIDCGLAGTVMRFIPPLAALADAPVVFDGDAAARRRPLAPLLDALAALGAEVDYLGEPGFLPVRVGPGDGALLGPADPGHLETPHRVSVDASGSSQFLSALLLAGCLLPGGLAITPTGPVPSLPHVAMTVEFLRGRGLTVDGPDADAPLGARTWTVHPGAPRGGEVVIEPDLSNAGPFLAAALVAGGRVGVRHWPERTTQAGDAWRWLLPRLGGAVEETPAADGSLTLTAVGTGELRGIDVDLSAVGELTPTVAALAALASAQGHASRLRGIAHLRGHETDRLAALSTEINRIGGAARETADGLEIAALPAGTRLHPARLRSYADHRMATFAAVVGLGVPGIEVDDIACTAKTLPDFPALWARLLRPSRRDRHLLHAEAGTYDAPEPVDMTDAPGREAR